VNIGERNRRESGSDESFSSCRAVSPFKSTEAETFAQYYKVCKKIAAGARFVIAQVGCDVRKYPTLFRFEAVNVQRVN
jgi:methylenetetrahydrofolate reductase (NADPH)